MIEYIFFRFYKYYLKTNNPPLFGSYITVFCILFAFLFSIIGNIGYILGLNGLMAKIYFVLISIALLFFLYRKFIYHKKYKLVISKFEKNKYNRLIPDWIILFIFPFSAVIGFSFHFIVYINLIKKFNLEGIVKLFQ